MIKSAAFLLTAPTFLIEHTCVRIPRLGRRRVFRRLAIGLLITSVVHVPLPQADFHNVRHHDSPGEACPYHEHLLRWHPRADRAADVAFLHWHWFVPLEEMGGVADPRGADHGAGQGAAIHAQAGFSSTFVWCFDPACQAADESRLAPEPALTLAGLDLAPVGRAASLPIPPARPAGSTPRSGSAPIPASTLVRLNC